MTRQNDSEDQGAEKRSLCPLGCMGNRRKPDLTDGPEENPEATSAPIDEFHDVEEDPGYMRIGSVFDPQTSSSNRDQDRESATREFQDEQEEEFEEVEESDGEGVVEEVVEAQKFNDVEACVTYAQVYKPSAPSMSSAPPPPPPPTEAGADPVPAPRTSSSPPAKSKIDPLRSPKRVGFEATVEAHAGPSASPKADLGAFGDMMMSDDAELEKPPAKQGLLSGVSFNSYGWNSLTLEKSQQQPDPTRRSQSSEQSTIEVENLKKTIRQLTSELSRQLTSRGLEEDSVESQKLLPGKGPVPPWLCDTRVCAPLLAAYEQRLELRSEAADRCETKLLALEQRIKEVVKENERLRVKLRESQVAGPSSESDWELITEQARLVLEENQLMIHQLQLQQEKAKQAHKSHTAEVVRLNTRIEELEAENKEAKEEFDRLRGKLQEVKSKYQSAVMDREDEELLNVDRVKAMKRELQEAKDEHKQATADLLRQLQAIERERTQLLEALAEAAAEKEKLKIEVNGLKELLQTKHRDNLVLKKFAKKHSSLKRYLDSVISEATELQTQRDSCKMALEEQEKEFSRLVNQLLAELRSQSTLRDSTNKEQQLLAQFQSEQQTPSNGVAKLEKLIARLLEILKENEEKRDEAEKQVRYLQSLLKQKSEELQLADADKRNFEEELEATLQKATSAD